MPIIKRDAIASGYDLIIAGTGFGALFFLAGYRRKFPHARVLLLEWGKYCDKAWQIQHRSNSDPELAAERTYSGQAGEKIWNYTIGYGGGTNCWGGGTPRLLPSDFRLNSLYGAGEDWPISYDDLEPYYLQAERIMHIAGPQDIALHYPRSGPYPQPPHHLSSVDKLMKAAMPDLHFAVPTARLRLPVGNRGACCDTDDCSFCPTEAKFSALNTFGDLIADPNLHLCVESRVIGVETQGGVAKGLRFEHAKKDHIARGDLLALGCNAIQTPFILLRSGFKHPALGRYLHEKLVTQFEIFLDGLDHFDGGIPFPGHNIALLDGEHRKTAGAANVFFSNHWRAGLRTEWGRWRQTLIIEVAVEDMPLESNYVADEGGDHPAVYHPARSDYCARGVERAIAKLPELLKPLPVEKITRLDDIPTSNHLQGTCRMGRDPGTSIVDGDLMHHQIRNLLILGTAVWPNCGSGNASLTAAALSLRAADRIGA